MAHGLYEVHYKGNGIVAFYRFINNSNLYALDDVARVKNANELMRQYNIRQEQKNLFGPWRVYRKDLEEMFTEFENLYVELDDSVSEDEKMELSNLLKKLEELIWS